LIFVLIVIPLGYDVKIFIQDGKLNIILEPLSPFGSTLIEFKTVVYEVFAFIKKLLKND
jgi:hypothetical protein